MTKPEPPYRPPPLPYRRVLVFTEDGDPERHRCALPDTTTRPSDDEHDRPWAPFPLGTLAYCEECRRWYVIDNGNNYGQPEWYRVTWLDRLLSRKLRRQIRSHTSPSMTG